MKELLQNAKKLEIKTIGKIEKKSENIDETIY